MKTVKQAIEQAKIRKGPADGTTKRGAYWMRSILVRHFGGDGIGTSSPDMKMYLDLRHYRSGEVAAIGHYHAWHQNHDAQDDYEQIPAVLDAVTAEDVIVALKGARVMDTAVYSDRFEAKLIAFFAGLGIPAAAPAPDEDTTAATETKTA